MTRSNANRSRRQWVQGLSGSRNGPIGAAHRLHEFAIFGASCLLQESQNVAPIPAD
jgi:hypothetical protein